MKNLSIISLVIVFVVLVLIVAGILIYRKPAQNQQVNTTEQTEELLTPTEFIFNPEGSQVTKERDPETRIETTTIILSGVEYSPKVLREAYLSELTEDKGWLLLSDETSIDQIDLSATRGAGGEGVSVRIAPVGQEIYVYVVYRPDGI